MIWEQIMAKISVLFWTKSKDFLSLRISSDTPYLYTLALSQNTTQTTLTVIKYIYELF